MLLLHLILSVIHSVYLTSADPNLFGAVKRRKGKREVAEEFKTMSSETQDEIDSVRSQNPFEGAAAKAAMLTASRNAKRMSTRMLNTMGAGATPEALISAQGATNEAMGATAGQIAVGSEAAQKNEIAGLRNLKQTQMGAYGTMRSAAEDERGSGWNTLFQGIDSFGKLAEGIGAAGGAAV